MHCQSDVSIFASETRQLRSRKRAARSDGHRIDRAIPPTVIFVGDGRLRSGAMRE